MFSIGDRFLEARDKKGKSLKDAEKETKIRAKYLEALEHNNFNLIPGDAYVKIFIREYANFLSIDPDPLVDEYENKHQPVVQNDRFLAVGINSGKRKRSLIWGSLFITLLALTGGLVLWSTGWLQVRNERADLAQKTKSSKQSDSKVIQESEKNDQKKCKTSSSDDGKSLKARITVIGRQESSLKVEVDGKEVFDKQIKAGEIKEWSAQEEIVLTIGNPSALRVEKNGVPVKGLENETERPVVEILTKN